MRYFKSNSIEKIAEREIGNHAKMQIAGSASRFNGGAKLEGGAIRVLRMKLQKAKAEYQVPLEKVNCCYFAEQGGEKQ